MLIASIDTLVPYELHGGSCLYEKLLSFVYDFLHIALQAVSMIKFS